MAEFAVRAVRGRASGDAYSRAVDEQTSAVDRALAKIGEHQLDGEKARETLRKLLEWFYYEKDRQATNRIEMAMDADFYDGIQWDPEDAAILRERGQMPLVFNEVAPMVDWVIGTERRTRVDWSVLPRTEDDVAPADVKTKVMKYVSDLNRVQFNRSRGFADSIKVGVGWLDDGVRDDPTEDVLYSKYEDWRNVLWDSAAVEADLSDARYLFRWRWVDEDIAVMMFPDRADKIRSAVEDAQHRSVADWDEDTWYSAEEMSGMDGTSGRLISSGYSGISVDAKRRRVRLIECQYRMPVQSKVVSAGPLKGAFFDPRDEALMQAVQSRGGSIIDKVVMRVHYAVFTDAHLLGMGPSIFRHNRFSLTPIWCYRRSRDRMPYGMIRRVRDVQQDLNKRGSKGLWLFSSNQVVADEGATNDWDNLREQANDPNGLIIKRPGKEVTIRRDTEAAAGQVQMMTMDAQSIQKSAGVSQENLGRQTNAVSGEAIKARQLQGSVVTTEPFDNLRLAVQIQGEKQLSLIEQFYTEEKVVRLTGARGKIEWLRVNQPEQQPDGSFRLINDIASSMSDFVVSDADYAGTMRQVMFEHINQLAGRLPPEMALRLLIIAMEFSDLPNKDEVAEQFRAVVGVPDPNKEPTPEEEQRAQEQRQAEAEANEIQRQTAIATLQEQQAKVREINARAAKAEAEALTAQGAGGDDASGVQAAVAQIRQAASEEIDRLSNELTAAQAELRDRRFEIRTQADNKLEVARIEQEGRERVAEIQAKSDNRINAVMERLKTIEGQLPGASKAASGQDETPQ